MAWKIALTPRRKKRGKWKVPSLKGFAPDALDGIWESITEKAAALETDLMKYATEEAIKKNPVKAGFMRGLRKLVAMGLGKLTAEAHKVTAQAHMTGAISAANALEDIDPNVLQRLKDSAPKRPRNVDTGVTVRATKQLHESIKDLAPRLMGSGSELYDDVLKAIIANPPESDAARRKIAQQVLDKFKDRGITGFIDKAGRRWNLVSYVEMATRTAASEVAMQAHLKEITAAGLDVVRVTVMPNCHPFCKPYQGRLLSITGKTVGTYYGERVVASIPEAISKGFRHPNCRHTVHLHVPGMFVPDPETIDPGDYKATQDLRALERQIRKWKRVERTALTPDVAKMARGQVYALQAKVRDHVKKTGVPRNRWREQIDRAL